MKVTNDPAGRQNPIREGAGPVTSDSLAAESVRAGGLFAENRDSDPLAVKGANSTFNTTDTSAADVLPPARDAAHRPGPEEELPGLGKGYVAGARKGSGTGSSKETQQHEQHTPSEGVSSSQDTKGSSGEHTSSKQHGTSAGKESGSGHEGGTQAAEHHHGHHGGKKQHNSETTHQPEPAPTYVKADILDQPLHQKPKGRNLTEGGIEEDAPNASSTAEIGSEDDPGRLAEERFARTAAQSVLDVGDGPKQNKTITDDDQFKVLGEEEAP
jgi:hypothetical protein